MEFIIPTHEVKVYSLSLPLSLSVSSFPSLPPFFISSLPPQTGLKLTFLSQPLMPFPDKVKNGYLWFCFVWGEKPDLVNLLVVLCRLRTDYKNHLKSGQQKSCKQNEYLLMIINKNQILKCNDFSKIRPLKMDFQNLSGPEGKCK